MTRGGKRPGSGRPPARGAAATERATVWLTEAEHAELAAASSDGESVADVLRDGGLAEARRRAAAAEV